MPLTAAYDWVDVIVSFDTFSQAAAFGNALGEQDGLLTKLITPIAAPIPQDFLLRHRKFFHAGKSIVLVMVATGVCMYLGYGGWIIKLHRGAAITAIGYIFAHVIVHYLYGGWLQLFRIFLPQGLRMTIGTEAEMRGLMAALREIVAG